MTYPSARPPSPTHKPGPKFVIALIVMVIGAVIAVGGLVAVLTSIVHDVQHTPSGVSPLTTTRELKTGTWEVYSVGGTRTVQPSDVTVTGPNGLRLPTKGPDDTSGTLRINGHAYDPAVQFVVPVKGRYQVQIAGTPGTQVLLSRPLIDVAKDAGVGFAVLGAGILIGIIGAVLWIVGASRRRRALPFTPGLHYAAGVGSYPPYPPDAPATPPAGAEIAAAGVAPAGWYMDPDQPGTTRWWDGTQWTEHRNSP
jgi:Protein of unknown function (DUF2510)